MFIFCIIPLISICRSSGAYHFGFDICYKYITPSGLKTLHLTSQQHMLLCIIETRPRMTSGFWIVSARHTRWHEPRHDKICEDADLLSVCIPPRV